LSSFVVCPAWLRDCTEAMDQYLEIGRIAPHQCGDACVHVCFVSYHLQSNTAEISKGSCTDNSAVARETILHNPGIRVRTLPAAVYV
jgi:hypothetical protein